MFNLGGGRYSSRGRTKQFNTSTGVAQFVVSPKTSSKNERTRSQSEPFGELTTNSAARKISKQALQAAKKTTITKSNAVIAPI